MRQLLAALGLALLTVLMIACGADDEGTSTADADTSTTEDTYNPGETLQFEAPDEEGELLDCISGCVHEGDPTVFEHEDYDGLQGTLDGNCHDFGTSGRNGDIDIIGLTAATRTMLEITVEPAPGSLADPLITTHDGLKGMNYNDNRSEGERMVRVVVAFPYPDELPIFVIVEDANNYDRFGADCTGRVGGEDYGYILRVRELPFEPDNFGELPSGANVTHTSTLTQGGDTQYFSFTAPAMSSPSVTVQRTGSSSFWPTVVAMKTSGGEMRWESLKESDGGTVSLDSSAFRVCDTECDAATGEFVFAVLDWEGVAWPGEFSYDVTVTLP